MRLSFQAGRSVPAAPDSAGSGVPALPGCGSRAGLMAALWLCLGCGFLRGAEPAVRWADVLRQPAAWYAGDEARRIATTVMAHQRESGGWAKNVDMAAPALPADLARWESERGRVDSTIDNGATTTPLRFLARVQRAQPDPRIARALNAGLRFLLDAQYANGGWPQYWPQPRGYAAHVTFNDNAMVNVLRLLREAAAGSGDFAFVDPVTRSRAAAAVARGVDCILRCQVVVDGKATVWCAQHDEQSLAPAGARSYEHPSLSGAESVGVVQFLMGIVEPDRRIIDSIEAAVAWFERVQINGIRVVERADSTAPSGHDRVVVDDAAAPPIWARFYELGTNRPIFSGRDGVIRYRLAEIELERRTGYAWYTTAPAKLLGEDLPSWRARIGRSGKPDAR